MRGKIEQGRYVSLADLVEWLNGKCNHEIDLGLGGGPEVQTMLDLSVELHELSCCSECGAKTALQAESMCNCSGDSGCYGSEVLWIG